MDTGGGSGHRGDTRAWLGVGGRCLPPGGFILGVLGEALGCGFSWSHRQSRCVTRASAWKDVRKSYSSGCCLAGQSSHSAKASQVLLAPPVFCFKALGSGDSSRAEQPLRPQPRSGGDLAGLVPRDAQDNTETVFKKQVLGWFWLPLLSG